MWNIRRPIFVVVVVVVVVVQVQVHLFIINSKNMLKARGKKMQKDDRTPTKSNARKAWTTFTINAKIY